MILPPKHAPACRAVEDLILGNALACRACAWYAAVEQLLDAAEELADEAAEWDGRASRTMRHVREVRANSR